MKPAELQKLVGQACEELGKLMPGNVKFIVLLTTPRDSDTDFTAMGSSHRDHNKVAGILVEVGSGMAVDTDPAPVAPPERLS